MTSRTEDADPPVKVEERPEVDETAKTIETAHCSNNAQPHIGSSLSNIKDEPDEPVKVEENTETAETAQSSDNEQPDIDAVSHSHSSDTRN